MGLASNGYHRLGLVIGVLSLLFLTGYVAGNPTSCKTLYGLEYKGGGTINNGKKTITSSDQECCSMCNRRSDCKHWTRTKWWNNGSLEGECWLRKHYDWKQWGQDAYNSGSKAY